MAINLIAQAKSQKCKPTTKLIQKLHLKNQERDHYRQVSRAIWEKNHGKFLIAHMIKYLMSQDLNIIKGIPHSYNTVNYKIHQSG